MSIIGSCVCGNKFRTTNYKRKIGKGKYCSKKCFYENKTRCSGLKYKLRVINKGWFIKGHVFNKGKANPRFGMPPWNKGTKGIMKVNGGSFTAKSVTGTKNINWKGDKVGYGGIHGWITRKLGQPKYCKHCNQKGKGIYHWHNISKLYLRDFRDWIRLCQKCHFRHERKIFGNG